MVINLNCDRECFTQANMSNFVKLVNELGMDLEISEESDGSLLGYIIQSSIGMFYIKEGEYLTWIHRCTKETAFLEGLYLTSSDSQSNIKILNLNGDSFQCQSKI